MLARYLIFVLLACKPFVQVENSTGKTAELPPATYENFLDMHKWVEVSSFGIFPELSGYVYFVQELEAGLRDQQRFNAEQRTHLQKILHKMHSIISFAIRSGCFVVPEDHIRNNPYFFQEIYSIDKAKMVMVEKEEHSMMIHKKLACAYILRKMRQLNPEQIDHTQTNASYYHRTIRFSDVDMKKLVLKDTSDTFAGHIQVFFKEHLLAQIIINTQKTMGDIMKRFPFHRTDFYHLCLQRKKQKFTGKAILPGSIENAKKLRNAVDCRVLKHPPTTLTAEQPVFSNITMLVGHLNYIVAELNKHRAELHKLVRNRIEIVTAEENEEVAVAKKSAVKPRYFLLPFIKIFQDTDLTNEQVLKNYDAYHEILTDATMTGTLPILISLNRKKIDNPGLHLDHIGGNFGFTSPNYHPLPPLSFGARGEERVFQEITRIKTELLDSWLEAKKQQLLIDTVKEKEIYTWMLAYELATAQVLLQDPTQAAAVSSLLWKFQSDPLTPKWLRIAKTTTEVLDITFLLLILGSVIGIVPYSTPLALASTAVNFLWMGTTTATERLAYRRLRLAERALLTGNSEQVRCGMKLLQKFYEKRRDASTSLAFGGAFTLAGLSMIAKGLDGKLKTAGVEVAAAFSSEIEIVSGGREDDQQTHTQSLEDCFE